MRLSAWPLPWRSGVPRVRYPDPSALPWRPARRVIQELLRGGPLGFGEDEQDAPDNGDHADKEERLGGEPLLPGNGDHGSVQQLDEDEDQEHPAEDRERRLKGTLLANSQKIRPVETNSTPTVASKKRATP